MEVSTLASVAEIGNYLFTSIFTEDEQDILRAKAQDVRDVEETNSDTFWLGETTPPKVLVLSDRINVPWELLYLSQDLHRSGIEEGEFLGSSFFVHQDSLSSSTERYFLEKPFKKSNGIRVFADNEHFTLGQEAPRVVQLFEEVSSQACLAPSFESENSGRGELAEAINDCSEDIIHFACHADIDTDGEVRIHVRNGYVESGLTLMARIKRSPVGPLVFLNACELSMVDSSSYDTLINHLLKKRFAAVVATEIRVDSELAWKFSNSVYEYFLNYSCRSFHRAIFYARRKLARDYDSMIGYTYNYYGIRDLAFV